MGVEKEQLKSFAVVEMMGHRKIVGQVKESDIGVGQLLRVDVFNKEGKFDRTEYIGANSIYCLTIVSEEAAKAAAARNAPEPAWAWNLPQPKQLGEPVADDYEEDDYEEGDFEEDEDF